MLDVKFHSTVQSVLLISACSYLYRKCYSFKVECGQLFDGYSTDSLLDNTVDLEL
jgi:hypothetical protein